MPHHVLPVVSFLVFFVVVSYALEIFARVRRTHRLRLKFERRFPHRCFDCATCRQGLEPAGEYHWPCREHEEYTIEEFLRDLWIQFQARHNDIPLELRITSTHADALEAALKGRGELLPTDDIRKKKFVLYGALIVWDADATLFQ